MQEAKDPEAVDIGEVFGNVSENFLTYKARFLSLADFSSNFDNYRMWKLHMGAIFSSEETLAVTSSVGIAKMSREFKAIFSDTDIISNFQNFTDSEKARMVLFLANQRLFRWVTWLITTDNVPFTINSVIFILELSRSLTQADGVSAEMAAMIVSLGRGGTISRREIHNILTAKHFAEWLPTYWSGKIKVALDRDPEWADSPIPLTWALREANASEWLSSFETLKLWAKGSEIYVLRNL